METTAFLLSMCSDSRRPEALSDDSESLEPEGHPRPVVLSTIVGAPAASDRQNLARHYRRESSGSVLGHIKKTGIPSYRRVRGNLAAYVLRRTSNGATEFVVVSIWNSWDAIRRFTGSEDPSAAIYYEEDKRYLIFKEPKAAHYELALVHESDSSVVYEYNPFEGTA